MDQRRENRKKRENGESIGEVDFSQKVDVAELQEHDPWAVMTQVLSVNQLHPILNMSLVCKYAWLKINYCIAEEFGD